jgi:pimeloyl-ACP methyl ester carboxylesterase
MKKLFLALVLIVLNSNTTFSQSPVKIEKNGKGTPIMYLPGFTTPGSVWDETIKNIKAQIENNVVSYAGFDGLEPIGTPWYSPIKDELVKYVKKEKLTNLTIIGHSMGGNLAIDIAAELPNNVSGLILVESIPCMRELMMPGVPAESLQYDSPYNNQVLQMEDEAFKQMAVGMAQNMTLNESKMEMLANWSVIADRKTYVYGYTDLLKLDLRDKLLKINCKTLILGAANPNKSIVESNYEKQYSNLKSKEILVVDNSKHFIMFDQPEWFYEQVNNFLK